MQTAQVILLEIADLLARYEYTERSNFVRVVAASSDPEHFWTTVSGLEFWGGSGAVWEVEPFHLSHPDVADAARDYRCFQRRMVDLSDALQQHGLANLSQRNADLFRRDLGD